MSLSCKGEDYSEIEMGFHNELNAISNEGKMFYHGGLKRIIKVKMGNFFFVLIDQKQLPYYKFVITMEHFLHFGDIVVRLMDTAKKTTYHHAKNVRITIYTRLFLANSMNLTKQIFCSCVREHSIFMQKVMSYNHAMEENVHHGLSFIFHLHFVHQQTIQSTMINNLVPCFLLMEVSLNFQFKEHNECCVPFI